MPNSTLPQKLSGMPCCVILLLLVVLIAAPLTFFLIGDQPSTARPNIHTASNILPREDSAQIVKQMWEQYLNGPGVTIKMFECGGWGVSAKFGECIHEMIHSNSASVMRFDLPTVAFVQSLPVGFAYKANESLQWCASPGDIAIAGAGCDGNSRMTKEQYLNDYKERRKQCPWPAYSPHLSLDWSTAFSYQHFLQRSIAKAWTEEDERLYKQNQLCMFYNEVKLKNPEIHDIQAIVVRNLSKDDGGPLMSLELAYELRRLIEDRYNFVLPIVQYALIEEECYNPRATVARWDAGKAHAENSIFFPAFNTSSHIQSYSAEDIVSLPQWVQKAGAEAYAAYAKCNEPRALQAASFFSMVPGQILTAPSPAPLAVAPSQHATW